MGQGPLVRVERRMHDLLADDWLLMCTDGLSGVVIEETIGHTLMNANGAGACCDQLVAEANRAGGPDNISVVAVRFRPGEQGSNLKSDWVIAPAERRLL